MKTYVLTLSKVFLKGHPKEGQPTNFKERYLAGEKIHTIRAGEYWRKVVEEVNAGIALLSVREWSGKPYASKQTEIGTHYHLGWQDFEVDHKARLLIDGKRITGAYTMEDIAKNDGLARIDFANWFSYPNDFKGGIIHFTDFRY